MNRFLQYKLSYISLKNWKRPSSKTILIILGVLLSVGVLFRTTELSFNKSESLPPKVFLILKGTSFKKGDLIAIQGHNTKYYPAATFVKRVMGFPGDQLTHQGKSFFINSIYGGELLEKTSFGGPLTSLKNIIIPDGYFFLKADHTRSFDSRYEEFGLVKEEHIKGRAFGLW